MKVVVQWSGKVAVIVLCSIARPRKKMKLVSISNIITLSKCEIPNWKIPLSNNKEKSQSK